jgi:hypothetical protein
MGICALMCAIWNRRSNLIFNKGGTTHFLQVIHTVT